MATSRKLGLTRDQLASFLDDFEKIKQFERLFTAVDTVVEATDGDGFTIAESAVSRADQAQGAAGYDDQGQERALPARRWFGGDDDFIHHGAYGSTARRN